MPGGDSGGGPGDAVGGAAESAKQGLGTAADVAGEVLRGIFGGLPWELSPDSIVDAVTGAFVPRGAEFVGVVL